MLYFGDIRNNEMDGKGVPQHMGSHGFEGQAAAANPGLQTDLPPPSEQVARGGPGGYFRGETRPRRGCVRRRLTGFFRDNFGAGNAGKTARISCCAAA